VPLNLQDGRWFKQFSTLGVTPISWEQALSSQFPTVSAIFQQLTPPVVVVTLQAAWVKLAYVPHVAY